MKVLFVTDVHTSEPAVAWVRRMAGSYDSVIAGGDLAMDTKESQTFVFRFLKAAQESNGKVLYVPGNADLPDSPIPDGVVQLHGRTSRLGRFKIGGLGGSNITPFGTPNELRDEEAEKVLSNVVGVDILVSHCPPQGTKCDRVPDGHVGSLPVRRFVEREKPMVVLSGHVHEARSVDNLGGTTVVNPGPLKDGKYAEVRLDGLVSVELKSEALAGA